MTHYLHVNEPVHLFQATLLRHIRNNRNILKGKRLTQILHSPIRFIDSEELFHRNEKNIGSSLSGKLVL